jgi:hemin uptake protein HemP
MDRRVEIEMSAAADEEEQGSSGRSSRMPSGIERRLTIVDNHIASRDLFVGTRDIVIVHGRDAYRLRLTAQNKLILTK